jgi:hypothetical protein
MISKATMRSPITAAVRGVITYGRVRGKPAVGDQKNADGEGDNVGAALAPRFDDRKFAS